MEAIEDLFHPVLVYNNREGRDAELLKEFEEPSWNNPVIRYLDATGQDIIERKDRVWSTGQTAGRMVDALRAAKCEVPPYLGLLAAQTANDLPTATFAMDCYWEGEAWLGSLRGVHETHSAWLRGKEVVEITYDPEVVDYQDLVRRAQEMKCASNVFARDEKQLETARQHVGKKALLLNDDEKSKSAKSSDQKYYLRNSILRHLPLTRRQAVAVNSALGLKRDYRNLLSPRQLKLLHQLEMLGDDDGRRKIISGMMYPADELELDEYESRLKAVLAKDD